MSTPKKTTTQLFASARALPPELGLDRVADIISQFPPRPEPPAGLGLTPKIISLLLLLTALSGGLYLVSGPGAPAAPALTGSVPADVEKMATVVEEPFETAPPPATDPPGVAPNRVRAVPMLRVTPVVSESSEPTFIAPAAAPEFLSDATPDPAPVTRQPVKNTFNGPTSYVPAGRKDDPIEGQYMVDKGKITLMKTVRIKGRKVMWVLPADLSPEEDAQLKTEGFVERETGRLALMKGKDGIYSGDFTFQPNSAMRAGYEQRGWGTSQARAGDVNMTGAVKGLPMREEIYTEEPADLLWLRYFIVGVDNGYLGLLDELGFPERSFTDLWKLPNAAITKDKLRSLTKSIRRISPLYEGDDLDELVAFYDGRRLLDDLYDLGYRDVTPLEIKALNDAKVFSGYLKLLAKGVGPLPTLRDVVRYREAGLYSAYPGNMNAAIGRELALEELVALNDAKVFPANIERMKRDGFRGLSVAEYIELHTAPRKVATKLLSENDGMIVDVNYARSGKVKKTETKRLGGFSTLIVDRDISVVVIPDRKNRAEIGYLVDSKWLDVKLKADGRGRLRISKKTRLGATYKGFTQAEVRLYASDLEKIVVDERSRVFVVGGLEGYEVSGPVGRAVLVE